MSIKKPSFLRVWARKAASGDVVDPDETMPGKFEAGWQAEVPTFEHFNYIQQSVTKGLAYLNEQGICEWDKETAYPKGAIVKAGDNLLYVAQVENTDKEPISNTEQWEQYYPTNLGRQYKTEIDLTGLSTDIYYPVWWRFPDRTIGRMEIYRHYYRDEGLDPFGDGDPHIAHLALEMEGNGHIWSGESCFLDIKRLGCRYRPTVRAIRFGAKCTIHQLDDLPIYGGHNEGDVVNSWVDSGCYLRGGLSYTVTSDFEGIYYSRDENPVEMYRQKHSGGTGFILRTQPRKIDDEFLGNDYLNSRHPHVPSGMIAMWSGTVNNIPQDWKLCDGEGITNYGTPVPDLRDRFILGAGKNETGTTGGSETYTTEDSGEHGHTFTVQPTTLTADNMPSHQHDTSWGEHGSGHFGAAPTSGVGSGRTDYDNSHFLTSPEGKNAPHSHGIDNTPSGAHSHSVKSMPPYYVLAYIIKM